MDYVRKAKLLVNEALPYLQKFKNKIIVIKYGGNAMINKELKTSVMKDLAFLQTVGMIPVVVHGGGPEITRQMEKLGVKPVFIRGLRVTDKPTIRIIKRVFREINESIRAELSDYGVSSEGVYDCILVEQKNEELGFVGEVKSINPNRIMRIIKKGKIPIISPLGIKNGKIYNVNADSAATQTAIDLKAVKLSILTNVDGVLEKGTLIPHLSIKDAQNLIAKGVISDGMIPKVEACIEAVRAGCQKAHLLNGTIPHSLLFEIFTEKGIGTEIVKNER